MEKLLTIVIPSYNMEKYLPKCLESVLVEEKDLLDLLDVIVVNDGSKDGTSAIGHRYAAMHPNSVRVVDKENGHHGSCVNCGLKMARGRFIRILDADDYFDKTVFTRYLRKLIAIGRENKRIDAILTPFKRVKPDGSVIRVTKYDMNENERLNGSHLSVLARTISLPELAYSTELLRDIDYRQTEGIAYSDFEWNFLPFAAVKRCIYIDEIVYCYLIGREGQSVSSSEMIKSLEPHKKLLRNMLMLYESAKNDERFNKATLDAVLYRFFSMLSGIIVFWLPIDLIKTAIHETLGIVREYSPKSESMAMSVSISRVFGFNYVRFIETHPKFFLPYIMTIKFYLLIVHLVEQIKMSFRRHGAMGEVPQSIAEGRKFREI